MKSNRNILLEKSNRFSIKKFKVGVVSVLVGSTFFVAGGVALADYKESTTDGANSSITETLPSENSRNALSSEGKIGDNINSAALTAASTRENARIRKKREVEKNYNGTVTFVTNNGNTDVKFMGENETLDHTDVDGNKANTEDSGGGYSKAYFQGFSNVKYYNGSDGQIMVYKNEPIKNLFPEGLKGGEKVYAVYLSASSALGLSSRLKGNLVINKNITPTETLYNHM